MLALFGPIKAEVHESELPFLKVKPQRKLSRTPQIVSARVGERAFRLKVKPVERGSDSTWVEVVDFFGSRYTLATALGALEERRIAPRRRATLTVRSPDLPGFRATTLDVSNSGLRLATAGPLEVGVRVRMEIDGREPSQRATDLSGVTVWSCRRPDDGYQVGIRLLSTRVSVG